MALGIILIPAACSKNFLNPADTQGTTAASLFHTPQDGISLVNAIYDGFQHDNQNFVLKGIWYNANYTTQDFFNWGADVSYNTYQFPTDFASLPVFWNDSYQGISRANSALPIIRQMQSQKVITDSLANFLLGQAFFLRGIYYYYLACTFGGVPLELNVITNGLHPRATQDSVFMQVASDMDSASLLLPWPQQLASQDLGRATKGAALGYKGAAEMWVKNYAAAITDFQALIPHYTLLPNFMSIHEYNNQNNAESIFEIQFALPAGQTPDWSYGNNEVTWQSSFMWPWETSNFGYTYANKLLYTSYESGDLRKPASVIGPDDLHTEPRYHRHRRDTRLCTGHCGFRRHPLVAKIPFHRHRRKDHEHLWEGRRSVDRGPTGSAKIRLLRDEILARPQCQRQYPQRSRRQNAYLRRPEHHVPSFGRDLSRPGRVPFPYAATRPAPRMP